jgi:hypothetical protein
MGAVLLLSGPGCKDEKRLTPPPEVSPYLEQSSAENILKNLRTAYENQVLAEYDKLFSADYIFVFNPGDVGDPGNPTPQQWPRADEMDSARNLFADSRVELITLDWSPGALETHDPYGWRVRVNEVNLNVNTVNENGELWIYQVRGSYQVFFFREENETFPNGKHKWTCTRWEDSPIGAGMAGALGAGMGAMSDGGHPRVEETSWGAIKAHFRRGGMGRGR